MMDKKFNFVEFFDKFKKSRRFKQFKRKMANRKKQKDCKSEDPMKSLSPATRELWGKMAAATSATELDAILLNSKCDSKSFFEITMTATLFLKVQILEAVCKYHQKTGELLEYTPHQEILRPQYQPTLAVLGKYGYLDRPYHSGHTCAHIAAMKADERALKILIECGADFKKVNQKGKSVLEVAKGSAKKWVAKHLLQSGKMASKNLQQNDKSTLGVESKKRKRAPEQTKVSKKRKLYDSCSKGDDEAIEPRLSLSQDVNFDLVEPENILLSQKSGGSSQIQKSAKTLQFKDKINQLLKMAEEFDSEEGALEKLKGENQQLHDKIKRTEEIVAQLAEERTKIERDCNEKIKSMEKELESERKKHSDLERKLKRQERKSERDKLNAEKQSLEKAARMLNRECRHCLEQITHEGFVFAPCGHIVVCGECKEAAESSTECFDCGAEATGVHKVFLKNFL